MTGVIFAIITSVFFALYIAPRKLSKLPAIQFNTLMAFGFTVGSSLLYFIQVILGNNEGLFVKGILYALLAGLFWTIAIMSLVKSIDLIGLARSNQWKNLQGPIGVLLSLFFLGEAASVNPWLALTSGIAIFSAAAAFNIQNSKDVKSINRSGVMLALLAGLAFGIHSMVAKWLTDNVGVYNQLVYMSATILVLLLIVQIYQGELSKEMIKIKREVVLGIGSGLLYVGASAFMLLSFQRLEASIAFTIIQLNFIGVVGLGIFVFKEIDVKGNEKRLLTGSLLALLGVVLLAYSR